LKNPIGTLIDNQMVLRLLIDTYVPSSVIIFGVDYLAYLQLRRVKVLGGLKLNLENFGKTGNLVNLNNNSSFLSTDPIDLIGICNWPN